MAKGADRPNCHDPRLVGQAGHAARARHGRNQHLGRLKKQYQVLIDPTLLIKYDISWETVMQAVRTNNLNVGGGSINRSGDMLLVHGVGRTNTIEQIEDIVVAAKAGVPIHVRDVAEVTIASAKSAVASSRFNGQGEAVLGLGFMLMGENSYAVTHRLADKLDEVKKQLPPAYVSKPSTTAPTWSIRLSTPCGVICSTADCW